MKLTRKQAIKECKEIWLGENGIVKSGLSKDDWLLTIAGQNIIYKYKSNCPLCEYGLNIKNQCKKCPLPGVGTIRCYALGFNDEELASQKWIDIISNLK